MAIEEVITVDAGEAISQLDAFAAAAEEAAEKYAAAMDKIKGGMSGGAGAAGADKMAEQMDAAAAKIGESADKINESLAKLGESGGAAGAGLGEAADAANTAAAANEKLAGSAGGAADAEKAVGDSAAAAGAALDESAAGADAAATATARVGAAGDEGAAGLDATAASADRARDSLGRFAASGDEAAVSSARVGESSAASAEAAGGFGKTAKTALLGVGIAAAYGIDKAMKFQSQMLLLNTQAGVSLPNVKKMSQGVLEVSTTTGQSLSNVAESAYHVASNMSSMGTSVPNMLNAVKVAAEGAAVGHSNMVDTTNALTATIASGMPGVKNYSQAMGKLNATVGSGDMSMQDLADAMGTGMMATVKGFGVGINDVGAGLATFGDNNIRGAKAGTEFKMAIQALGAPGTGPAAVAALKQLDLTHNTLAADMQKGGLKLAITDLTSHMKAAGDTGSKVGEVLTDAFGKKAGAGINILTEQEDRFLSKYPALTQGANQFGAAWAKTQATPQQQWKELGAGLQASAVNFGTSLLPAFSAAAGFANKILGDINGTKGAADALAIAFGGAAALFTGKKLVSGVESTVKTAESALGGLGKIFNIPGLSNIGKGSPAASAAGADAASGGLDKVAGAADAAAGALDKVAGAGDAAATGEDAAGAAGDKAAAGEAAAGAGGARAAAGEDAAGLGAGKFATALGGMSFTGVATLGVTLGLIIKGLGDKLAPSGTQAGKYNNMLQKTPATNDSSLMPNIFGGYEGKLMSSIGLPVGKFLDAMFSQQAAPAGERPSNGVDSRYDYQMPANAPPPVKPGASAEFTDVLGQAMASTKPAKIPGPDLSALDAAKAKVQADMSKINSIISAGKAAKIPAPDMSALEAAKGKATTALDAINRAIDSAAKKPAKMAAPDLSSLDAAKAKALSSGEGIQQAAQTAVQKPVRVAAPDLSPYVAAKGPAAADGAAIDAGLASGIAANAGAAVAAAQAVASQVAAVMAHALQTKSPSKVTEAIGKDTSAGLAKGITSGTSKVKTSALTLSAATITSLTQGLQGGTSAIDAALTAVTGKGSRPQDITTIISTISTLQGDLSKALAGKQISKPEDSALTKMLRADNTKLQALSAQRTMLETEITDSSQIAQQAISSASVMNALTATPVDPSQAVSSIAIIQGMQVQANQAAAFAKQIGQLQKSGLNSTSLNQITQSGATSGLPITQSLISGGPKAIAQINALEKQIQGSAAKLGDAGGPAMYQAGVQAAQGLAAGLKSQLGTVDAAITQMANSITAAIKKALKISSPSMVFAEIGGYLPQGLAQGVDAESAVAESAVSRLAARTAGAYGRQPLPAGHAAAPPGGYGGGSGGGSGGGNVTVLVTVTLDGKNITSAVQSRVLTTALNNVSGGFQLAGRNV